LNTLFELPTIILEAIEGGDDGKKVALATEDVITRFFTIGIRNIENECNKVSSKYYPMWSAKASEPMTECLGITYGEGAKELLSPFKLFEPASISIKILDSYCPSNPKAMAEINHTIDLMNPHIMIYLRALEIRDSRISWIGFDTQFEFVINHELLHACGDSPGIVGVRDGVIRQTLVCNEAIDNLSRNIS
jgi:hypothetical protein